jgi:cytochrome b561
MQVKNSPSHYGLIALSLHWLTVALVIIAWALGTFGDDFPRGPARVAGLFVHNTAGIAILALLRVCTQIAS